MVQSLDPVNVHRPCTVDVPYSYSRDRLVYDLKHPWMEPETTCGDAVVRNRLQLAFKSAWQTENTTNDRRTHTEKTATLFAGTALLLRAHLTARDFAEQRGLCGTHTFSFFFLLFLGECVMSDERAEREPLQNILSLY
jgi:hypothetical protein